MALTRINLSPLFHSTVGFDSIADTLDRILNVESAGTNYPPYDIEKFNDETYRITMALAGFGKKDISVTKHEGVLIISGARHEVKEKNYIHKGIALRNFERRFQLADSIKVMGADFRDGLLTVTLEREVPETEKPQNIPISDGQSTGKSQQLHLE